MREHENQENRTERANLHKRMNSRMLYKLYRWRKIFASLVVASALLISTFNLSAINNTSYAYLDPPAGTASGTTFTVKDTITDWGQLESLFSKYKIIKVASYASVCTNDLSKYIHLGDESGTVFIPKIECYTPKIMYPPNILPEYYIDTGKFTAAHDVNSLSNPTILTSYKWATSDLVYVYDSKRNNTVAIEHGVVDETGKKMIQYCRDTSSYEEIDSENNRVIFRNVDAPTETDRIAKIEYYNVITGHTSKNNVARSAYSYSLTYAYTLSPTFYSTVKCDWRNIFLGDIIVNVEDNTGKTLAGAEFEIYADAECKEPALRYSGSNWVEVGTVQSNNAGRVEVENLKAGKYYVKQKAAPEGYTIEKDVKEVIVENDYAKIKLSTESGEGEELKITKEEVVLDPIWNETVRSNVIKFEYDEDDYETVQAEDYNDGGEIFITSNGENISVMNDDDYQLVQSSNILNNPDYIIKMGDNVVDEFDTLDEAVQYINTEYIDEGALDGSDAQEHITIERSEDALFNNADNQSELQFTVSEVTEEVEEDRPVTAYETGHGALSVVVVAIIGIIMLTVF